MIYAIESKSGNIIAFSDNLEAIYNYIKDYYLRYDETELVISEITDEDICIEAYLKFEEFEVVNFYGDIFLTSWECKEYDDLFEEYRIDLFDYIKLLAKKNLGKIYDKVDSEDIRNYMKRTLGSKYNSLLNKDRFMRELGTNKIRELINGYGVSLELYYLNMEYKRKINDDK